MHPLVPLAVAAQVVLGNPGISALNSGARAIDSNDVARGIALSREALDSDMLSPFQAAKAYNNLCVGFFKLKLFEEALKNCDLAIERSGKNWAYYNNRAGAHWGLGRYEEAIADYQKALEFNPGSEKVQHNLGLVYERMQHPMEPPQRPGT